MSAPLPLGFLPDLPSEVYHAPRLGVVSKCALDRLKKSPAHYYAWATGLVSRTTAALAFGRAGHCAIFEPGVFATDYLEEPRWKDCRFKENKLERDAWRAEHQGVELISAEEMATLRGVQASIHRHELIRNLLSRGLGEVTVSWVDPRTGLHCKSRADYYVEKLATVVDLKLVEDASFDGFRKSLARYRYFVQDALYRAGFDAVGKPIKYFVFVAVEKAPPYASAVYTLDADGIARGYSAAQDGMTHMAECLSTNKWPGYPTGIQTIDVPPWAA
jgi:hypothetical protein